MNIKALIATTGVFVGCCCNVIFLELLVKADPGSGNLITFSQFLFIALEELIFTSKFGTEKAKIGLKDYFKLVVMFFVTSVCNNYAFNFNIPMPLHMIFRAGSLIANMIMGIIILKKRYDSSKYISVLMITAGIVLCTIVSGSDVKDTANPASYKTGSQYSVFFWWTVGIVLLSFALFISAYMGIYQEVLYKRFGKHPREALFYTHILPLPGFFLMYKNIWDHFVIATSSELTDIPLLSSTVFDIQIPTMLLYLFCNIITQYVCISSVYVLTTECASLTVTLVVTLRKFISLLFSILYFKNSFTIFHWMGSILVFIGTIVFTEVLDSTLNAINANKKNKKKSL